MSFIDRDVIVGTDGELHKVKLVSDENYYRFDEGQPILTVMKMASIRLAENLDAFSIDNETGKGYLLRAINTPKFITQTAGAYTFCFNQDPIEIYSQVPGIVGVEVFDLNGGWIRNVPVQYCSTGLVRVGADGVPITPCDYDKVNITIDGVHLSNYSESHGYRVGGSDVNGKPAMVLFTPSNSKADAKVYYIQTPRAARIASKDGAFPWVAITGFDTPEPDSDFWSDFPYEEPIPVPGYNPKADLIQLRRDLTTIIGKL